MAFFPVMEKLNFLSEFSPLCPVGGAILSAEHLRAASNMTRMTLILRPMYHKVSYTNNKHSIYKLY